MSTMWLLRQTTGHKEMAANNAITYITDVSYSRENTFKFIVSVNGNNREVIKEDVKYNNKREGQKCLKVGSVTVYEDFFIDTRTETHLSEVVLSIEIAKVIVESVGLYAFGGDK